MTKFVLLRHGEADYSFIKNATYNSQLPNIAPLTDYGKKLADKVSENLEINTANIIITSPYSSALQTAYIISNNTDISVQVEYDLHEWLPLLNMGLINKELIHEYYSKTLNDFVEGNSLPNTPYESLLSVKIRTLNVLKNYLNYSKVVVVTHEGVIRSLTNQLDKPIDYCKPFIKEYSNKTINLEINNIEKV